MYLLMTRVIAARRPVRCVPPSRCGMLLVKEHRLVEAVVPLHRHFDADVGALVAGLVADGVEDVRVQRLLALLMNSTKPLTPAGVGGLSSLTPRCARRPGGSSRRCSGTPARAGAWPGCRSGSRCSAGRSRSSGDRVHLGAALVGLAGDFIGLVSTPSRSSITRSCGTPIAELDDSAPAVAAHRQAQPLRQPLTDTPTPCKTARHLVAVLVELAAGVQLGQRDLGGERLARACRPSSRRSGMPRPLSMTRSSCRVDGDDDVVVKPASGLVDGVVRPPRRPGGAGRCRRRCRRYTCPGACAPLPAFEDLDAAFAVGVGTGDGIRLLGSGVPGRSSHCFQNGRLVGGPRGPGDGFSRAGGGRLVGARRGQIRIGITTYLKPLLVGHGESARWLASCSSSLTISWLMLASASIR